MMYGNTPEGKEWRDSITYRSERGELSPAEMAHYIRVGAALEKVRDANGNVSKIRLIWPGWK